jgi:hypothetical protein
MSVSSERGPGIEGQLGAQAAFAVFSVVSDFLKRLPNRVEVATSTRPKRDDFLWQ